MRSSRGSISALTVCLVLSMMTVIGLVLDGGASINEYVRLSDIAENAARAGAQEVSGIRTGDVQIDSQAAEIVGQKYLRFHGVTGTVTTTLDSVVVEVSGETSFQILSLIGLSSRSIHVLRTARLVAG